MVFPFASVYGNVRYVEIGIYYGLWFKGDYPTGSWNPIVIDKPLLGYYNSQNETIITQHIAWFNDLKIDFAMLIWRPSDTFVNQTLFDVFDIAMNKTLYTKFTLLVEHIDDWSFSEIYDFAYGLIEMYNPVYYRFEGKPLILFFFDDALNGGNFPRDDRFTVRVAGSTSYCDWLYENVSPYYGSGERSRARHVPVIPRFDETHFPIEERPNRYNIDIELKYLYSEEWQYALHLARTNSIDVITISCWNEYAERTAIEPHLDATAINKDPFYLYNLTKDYISELKGLTDARIVFWYQNPVFFGVIILGIALGVVILWKW